MKYRVASVPLILLVVGVVLYFADVWTINLSQVPLFSDDSRTSLVSIATIKDDKEEKDQWSLLVAQKVNNREILDREDVKRAIPHGGVSHLAVGILNPNIQCTWGAARNPSPPEEDAPRGHKYLANCYTTNEREAYYDGAVIEGADGETFEVVPSDKRFARDKSRIYFNGTYVGAEIIDAATFEAFNQRYTKDKNFVYYLNENIEEGRSLALLEIIERADPNTFEVAGRYAKDKNNIFLNNRILYGVDLATFQEIGERNFKDKNHTYSSYGKIIEGVDLSTFEDMPGGAGFYIKDKDHIFFSDYSYKYDFKIIEGADQKTFEILGGSPWMGTYARDSNFVYFGPRRIDGADPESLIVMQGMYAKDKNHTYFMGGIEK